MAKNNVASTEQAQVQELERVHINRKKKEIVRKIMAEVFQPMFNTWLEETFGSNAEEANEGEAGGTGRSKSSSNDQPSQSKGAGASNARGGRGSGNKDTRNAGSGDKDGEKDKENGGKRKRGQPDSDSNTEKQLLACPYYKRNPDKYKSIPFCCGPGWPTVHRLKEHLYRKHAAAKFICRRCYEGFEEDAGLQSHQRSETACPINKNPPPDGFDITQLEKLKKRSKSGGTEQEKWDTVFGILFPGQRIPNPYYDANIDLSDRASKKQRTLDQYEQYVTEHLPMMFEKAIDDEVEKELSGVEAKVKVKLVDIFCNIQHRLIRTFRYATANHAQCADDSVGDSPHDKDEPDAADVPKVDSSGDAIAQSLISPSQYLNMDPSLDIAGLLDNGNLGFDFDLDHYFGSQGASGTFDEECSSTFERDSGYGTVLSGDSSVDVGLNLGRYECGR